MHSAIERLLGELGPRVHAGRSRNDQVQTAMRLWAKDACGEALDGDPRAGRRAARPRPRQDGGTVLPGYTHGQRAQPVWLGHHLAAHAWALARDGRRFAAGARGGRRVPAGRRRAGRLEPAARPGLGGRGAGLRAAGSRTRWMPLPTATTWPGSATPAALCFVHLSRLGEELVLWTSAEYGFAELDDRAATGSSMMPQKKNPDAAELARGKAGTAIGRLAGLLATLKGLPLAYNRDLQEDKRAAFDQVDDLLGALAALRVCVEGLRFDGERMAAAAGDGRPSPPTWPSSWCARACRSARRTRQVASGWRPASGSTGRPRPRRPRRGCRRRRWPTSSAPGRGPARERAAESARVEAGGW